MAMLKMTTTEQHRMWHAAMTEPVHVCCWCKADTDHAAALSAARDEGLEEALNVVGYFRRQLQHVYDPCLCPWCRAYVQIRALKRKESGDA